VSHRSPRDGVGGGMAKEAIANQAAHIAHHASHPTSTAPTYDYCSHAAVRRLNCRSTNAQVFVPQV
jgi:hypothetical protein